jgi:DNA-binding response OmpR family regulator
MGYLRPHVLVVEDDEVIRQLLEAVLVEADFACEAVPDGEEGLKAARRRRPQLAILDVRLPGISGYEVCRALREEFGAELPIIFVSGERTEGLDRVAGLLVGADDYITKPFTTDELLARVRLQCRRAPGARPRRVLTEREDEVLTMLAEGRDQTAISSSLSISSKTVGTHIEHILSKLGVQSRAQAVAMAYRSGLLAEHDGGSAGSDHALTRAHSANEAKV